MRDRMSGRRAMSSPGDVAWADGRAWMRRHDSFGGSQKLWWMTCSAESYAWNTLANLKQHDDFEWLVKAGTPVVIGELLKLQGAALFHEGQIAAIVADRDDAYAQRRQMAVELDQWRRAAKRAEDGSLSFEWWVTGSSYERYAVVKWLRMVGQDQLADTISASTPLV